jgi:DNA-binding NarL/FixJ family response regulator
VIDVVLADDQTLVRAGFRALLDAEDDMTVVGEAADGEQALDLVRRLRPDVVLMDIRMPRTDGLTATGRRTADPALARTRVIVLTTFELDDYVFGALRAGAAGFLLKGVPAEDLQRAVRGVAGGESWLDPAVTGHVLSAYREGPAPMLPGPEADLLTPREREVLALIGQGLSNTEIATRLTLGEGTVKTHIGHIFTKLDLRDRAAAVVFAFDHGLVQPGRGR